jgi:flagellum-specific ATP synthase
MTSLDLGPAIWNNFFDRARGHVSQGSALEVRGTLTRLAGLVLEASGIRAPVGSQCIVTSKSRQPVLAEVTRLS